MAQWIQIFERKGGQARTILEEGCGQGQTGYQKEGCGQDYWTKNWKKIEI
jgi:hypothetical protein